MIEFLLSSQNMPFAIAIVVMGGLTLLEGTASLFGAGFSNFLDSILPEMDLDFDVDSPEFESPGLVTRFLGWLRMGEVPALVVLIVFLTTFGLAGFGIQSIVNNLTGKLLPALLASLLALIVSIPLVRIVAGILSKLIPKDETDAVPEASFIGKIAYIVLGRASLGKPAQAKLKDAHGQVHYIMIEPDIEGEIFEHGQAILIVSRQKSVFRGIVNPSDALIDG